MNNLEAILAPKPSYEELQAAYEALLKAKSKPLTLKISEKGGLSVYGLGRFPVTLYKSQWLRLLTVIDEIRQFIKDNNHLLKEKE